MQTEVTPTVWLVGNSQLITSVIPAYCTPESLAQCERDWQEKRVSKGAFRTDDNATFAWLSCNAGLLGDPTFVDGSLSSSQNLLSFARIVGPGATAIVLMLRGHEYAATSIVDSPRWDFSFKTSGATPGRPLVRQRDATAYFESLTNSILASCLVFKHIFPAARIYHVATPAPIESESHIRAHPEVFEPLFDEFGIRPFALRKKIYDAMYLPLAEKLAGFGIKTIFTPAEALTEAGGLRPEYAHGCLHGNAQYGRALMAELKRSGVYASV